VVGHGFSVPPVFASLRTDKLLLLSPAGVYARSLWGLSRKYRDPLRPRYQKDTGLWFHVGYLEARNFLGRRKLSPSIVEFPHLDL
jgi:hypothetical protein